MPIVEVNGIRLNYEDQGRGEPVVFIAGLMGGVAAWRLQVDALSDRFRCISLDNRGVGLTDKPDEAYSIGQFAEDVIGLLEHLGVERAHIVGSSMGGMIAQNVAIHHPSRVVTLSLHCTAAKADAYIKRVSEVYKELSYRFEVIDQMWVDIVSFTHDTYNERQEDIAALGAAISENPMPSYAFRQQLDALAQHDAEDDLGKIQQPTLIGCGQHDNWMPVSAAMRMQELIPNSYVEIFENMGHLYKWEDPQRFIEVQARFLKDGAINVN